MESVSFTITIFCMFCITTLPKTASSHLPNKNSLQTYIVHLDPHLSSQSEDLESWHRSFLPATTTASSGEEEPRLVYSYRHVFKGFSARLSADQVKVMEKKEGFISARPQKPLSLHTTHSPNFLGLNRKWGTLDSDRGRKHDRQETESESSVGKQPRINPV